MAGVPPDLGGGDSVPGEVVQDCVPPEENWVKVVLKDADETGPLNVPYAVYDLATGEQVASGTLDENGESSRHMLAPQHSQLRAIFEPPEPTDVQDAHFAFVGAQGHLRDVDAEAKILENLYNSTKPNSVGSVKLFTERDACSSCEGVIDQFLKGRPGINIELIENGGVLK